MPALARNWWMMAARGGLAVLFGLGILLWPSVTLSVIVMLFAVYAVLDGLGALAAALTASPHRLEAWPVALEGAVSVGIGALALAHPFVSREFVYWVAAWGLVTGILELVAAARLPREAAGHWLLATGGLCSLFLAVLILALPYADVEQGARLIGGYAVVFGVAVSLGAVRFKRWVSARR